MEEEKENEETRNKETKKSRDVNDEGIREVMEDEAASNETMESFDVTQDLRQSTNELSGEAKDNRDSEVGRNDRKQQMNPKKAMGLAGILVFGVLVLIFGGMRINKIIGSFFEGYGQTDVNLLIDANDANGANLALKNVDTDKDGLSDYDEMYIYGTSAYIPDTDSDGISDFDELEKGDDPLCARGQDCYGEESKSKSTNASESTKTTNTTNVDLEELKRVLKGAGMDADVVNQIDDETLLDLYSEALQEISINPLISTNQNMNDTNHESDDGAGKVDLENLTVEEIRQLLIQGGADEGVLEQVDDEALREIYLETLGEMEK